LQLLGKDDHIGDDSISSEEKWSLYVDQFVQLSTTEGINLKRREPFLRRTLPVEVGDDPPLNVETQSGLELKICVNTYKIFFVDNTEDYFRRKQSAMSSSLLNLPNSERAEAESLSRKKRSAKMVGWIASKSIAANEAAWIAWVGDYLKK
jgi:paired amphipathic helix protein Sin3a